MAMMGGTALSSVLGGIFGNKAAKKAGKAQSAAAAQARADMLAGRQRAEDLLGPAANYRPAQTRLMDLLGLNGGQGQQDAYAAFRDTPGYQFQVQQGTEAINRGAAAHGGAMAGRTMADLARFGQGMADQNFGNYYGRVNDFYGTGVNAAGQLAGHHMNAGQGLAGIAMQAGNNKAGQKIAQGNAWTGALQGVANSLGNGLGQIAGGQSSYGGSASPVWNGQAGYSVY
jgi:hypothetical protein